MLREVLKGSQRWDPDFAGCSPMFEPLLAAAAELKREDWPAAEDLERLLAARGHTIRTGGGMPLTIIPQSARPRRPEERYEARIFLRGELQVRRANWHDLLNVLVWLTFPRSKVALNARHYRASAAQDGNRSRLQDALTLFDEGGVIVAACDPRLLELVQGFQWKELFWRERAQLMSRMRFFLFGHALYEKALAPFSGITGRAILLEVERGFVDAPIGTQAGELDRIVAQQVLDPARFLSPRDLAPLPILGVPGWCAENASPSYYDDATYFRPGRGSAGPVP